MEAGELERRARKRPYVTVVLTVHDAAAHISRAIESVLDQDFQRVQLVVVDCSSTDGTVELCRRVAERDMRLDVIELDSSDRGQALDAGLDAARGEFVLFMEQDDWFGPQSLELLVTAAKHSNLQLVTPSMSFDTYYANGERASHIVGFSDKLALTATEFRQLAHCLIDEKLLFMLKGKLFDLDRIRELGLRFSLVGDDETFMATYLEDLERMASIEVAVYHAPRATMVAGVYSQATYERCERDNARLLGLARRWGMTEDEELMRSIHRLHLTYVIACIETICSNRALSSIERNERVRDIVEADTTQADIRALRHDNHEFGLMFGPIANRNVTACCFSAKVAKLVRFSRLTLAGAGSAA